MLRVKTNMDKRVLVEVSRVWGSKRFVEGRRRTKISGESGTSGTDKTVRVRLRRVLKGYYYVSIYVLGSRKLLTIDSFKVGLG